MGAPIEIEKGKFFRAASNTPLFVQARGHSLWPCCQPPGLCPTSSLMHSPCCLGASPTHG